MLMTLFWIVATIFLVPFALELVLAALMVVLYVVTYPISAIFRRL